MSETAYILKLSSQSQVTLPKELRERLKLHPGARLTVIVDEENALRLSNKLPIKNHFGSLPGVWTKENEDAAEYARSLRDSMQPKLNK
jgi:AbrB family looped-hinge helix DNA binding protein